MSFEEKVLGASKDPVAEARAFAAIADAGEKMGNAVEADDVPGFVQAKRNFDALEDAELAREEASETAEERAQIATRVGEIKAELHRFGEQMKAKDTPEKAARDAELLRENEKFSREWDEKVAKWKAAHPQ